MNSQDFSKKFDIDVDKVFFSKNDGTIFYLEMSEDLFTSKINYIFSNLKNCTNFSNIHSLNDLFDNINPINELVLDSGELSYISKVKFLLSSTDETSYLPVKTGEVFAIKIVKNVDKGIALCYCYKTTNLFNQLDDYLKYAFKNRNTKLFNSNMFKKHIRQDEDFQEIYYAVINIENFLDDVLLIDYDLTEKFLKKISTILYNETYSKVCVYHLKDYLFALKFSELDEDTVFNTLNSISKDISNIDINGFKPNPYIGYLKRDSSIFDDNLEFEKYIYMTVLLAKSYNQKIYFLDNNDIKKYISKYGNAISVAKRLKLKNF